MSFSASSFRCVYRRVAVFLCMALASLASPLAAATADEPGWVELFDGKTLAGWTQRNGTATYAAVDGMIVGTTAEGSPNSFLCSDKDYGDFELVLEAKVDDLLNAGVQIRSKTDGGPNGRVNGPQVEVAAASPNGSVAGYVYGEAAGGWMTPDAARTPHKHFKNGDWNAYRVVATGPRIQTWINGEKVGDIVHEERYKTHPKGFIGLQVHGIGKGSGPFKVEVDLMQPIDPEKKPAVHTTPLNHVGLWIDDLPAAVQWLSAKGVRFAPGGIRKGAAGFDICFLHPKSNEEFPVSGEGVLIELVQAPPEVVGAFARMALA